MTHSHLMLGIDNSDTGGYLLDDGLQAHKVAGGSTIRDACKNHIADLGLESAAYNA